MKRTLQVTTLLGLLVITGCGLGDYEQRMAQAQARVRSYDDANVILGDDIQLTMVDPVTHKAAAAPVFFRPPRSISGKAKSMEDALVQEYPSLGKNFSQGTANA